MEDKEADSLVILSLKKFRNDVARSDAEEKVGRFLGKVRDRREFRIGQSFFGFLQFWLIRVLYKDRLDAEISLATSLA